jgi:YegS/Rv2252/BmrU family lipid kinase
MKHIFLVNPVAGKGKAIKEILPTILRSVREKNIEYEIHRTVNVGDATRYVRGRCENGGGEKLRFYAVGGDGTLSEVLSGLVGYPDTELAVIPAGTGNDFIRNFPHWRNFRDVEKQINGRASRIDVLRYELLDEKGQKGLAAVGCALNMFNIGFDAEAAAATERLKNGPFLHGKAAYIGGVLTVLAKLKKLDLTVEIDGEQVASGQFLLAGVANGRFSGGGFDGSPLALLDDGLMDVTLVKSINRRFFLSVAKKYHDGTHYGDPRFGDILRHYKCREAVFYPEETMILAIDGETITVGGIRFTIVEGGVNLSIPV